MSLVSMCLKKKKKLEMEELAIHDSSGKKGQA
jgi:hypothetical protein